VLGVGIRDVLARACRLSVLGKTGVGGGGSAKLRTARDENAPRFVVDKNRARAGGGGVLQMRTARDEKTYRDLL
jgi:hypothetical protein